MKAALFILSHSEATPYVARHWPFFQRSGADLFGISRVDTHCVWPEPIPTKAIGKEGYIVGDDQCRRMVETLAWFMDGPHFAAHTHAWLMQGDAVLLQPLPQVDYDIAAHLAGGGREGFISDRFYHPPWVVSRKVAHRFVSTARTLLDSGVSERGIPDYFFTLVCDTMKASVFNIPGIFSVNSGDLVNRKLEGAKKIGEGAWYVHGAKTQDELEWILSCQPK